MSPCNYLLTETERQNLELQSPQEALLFSAFDIERNRLFGQYHLHSSPFFFPTVEEKENYGDGLDIKVWERDSGALHSTSESKVFMGGILEWMPSGAKIAVVYDRKVENRCPDIAFYERNGLVEHLKGMSLTAGAKNELRSLLFTLVKLGGEEIARKLQLVGENFQLTQMAAVKLAEDTISTDIINEQAHTLEHYILEMISELPNLDYFSWRSKRLVAE
ncbi:hypothetical protein SADUNF_Sadunf10G0161700 [Salix dunnii]|uniref:ELP1 first N-terminal beta-propeller domain-containing protein n=1 Tax=Salix dunnii TaxID=1413687 RepID=A0A835JRP9_9ROSI|nr:hypothetical protein SADUNF_Sadunf10G0161700 [Salix dunnii]